MSNRTLIELNHDYVPHDYGAFGADIAAYMRSGDPELLPQGVTFKHIRHHGEPCPLEKPVLRGGSGSE